MKLVKIFHNEETKDWRAQCPYCLQISMFIAISINKDVFESKLKINCKHLRSVLRSKDNLLENTCVMFEE